MRAILGMFLLVALTSGACNRDESEQLSEIRPLMLSEIPNFLRPGPHIDQIAGHTRVLYTPAQEDGPWLRLEQFNYPQKIGTYPEHLEFAQTETDENGQSFDASWRCGDIVVST